MSPDPSDVLTTFAEVAVAFAGFSSVVAIFQRSSAAGRASFDRFRFWMMLEFSLVALFFALLPFPLRFLGLDASAVWTLAGLTMVAFIALHTVLVGRFASRSPTLASSMTKALSRAAVIVYLVIVVSQLANALGLGFERRFGPYLLGLFLLLLAAGVNFVRLVQVGDVESDSEAT